MSIGGFVTSGLGPGATIEQFALVGLAPNAVVYVPAENDPAHVRGASGLLESNSPSIIRPPWSPPAPAGTPFPGFERPLIVIEVAGSGWAVVEAEAWGHPSPLMTPPAPALAEVVLEVVARPVLMVSIDADWAEGEIELRATWTAEVGRGVNAHSVSTLEHWGGWRATPDREDEEVAELVRLGVLPPWVQP